MARGYATASLLPLLLPCPLHRRAFEKPLGYAGDYQLMKLYFVPYPEGDTLFGRFIHFMSSKYTLAKAVVDRERCMREAVAEAIATPGEGPVRILSVACGPAIEIQNLIASLEHLNRPVELILLDQDQGALEACHREVSQKLIERHRGKLPMQLHGLHFSVKQFLKPQDAEELRVRDEVLTNLDLIYSAGLFDYMPDPVAIKLIRQLYVSLRPGGRLFVGNLKDAPDTSWILEFVIAWQLLYRTPASFRHLADGLVPTPSSSAIREDVTGHCMFLDVRRPR